MTLYQLRRRLLCIGTKSQSATCDGAWLTRSFLQRELLGGPLRGLEQLLEPARGLQLGQEPEEGHERGLHPEGGPVHSLVA